MIRHLVLLRLRPEATTEVWDGLARELAALVGVASGMVSFARLENVSPEAPVIHGFHDGFIADFVDAAARDAYLEHPAHRDIGARLVAACEGGLSGLLVFDHDL